MQDEITEITDAAVTQGQLFELPEHSPMGLARWLCDALTAGRIRFDEAVCFAQSTLSQRREAPQTRTKRLGIIDQFAAFATASGVEYLDQLRTTHVDDF